MSNASEKATRQSAIYRQDPSKIRKQQKFTDHYTYRHPSSYNPSKQKEQLRIEPVQAQQELKENRNQQSTIHEFPWVPYTYLNWGAALDSLLMPLHKLLAPPASPCLACGKIISDSARGFPEICSACYNSIPWIKYIKCNICGRAVGCPDCTRETLGSRYFILNRSVVSYTPLMREWLARFKFRGDEALGCVMARMVGERLRRLEHELRPNLLRKSTSFFDVVTYVPVSTERMLERGFNQAKILAEVAARVARIPLIELLQRSRHTDKQSSKNRKQRMQDLENIFIPSHDAEERIRSLGINTFRKKEFRILLIDDVYTTGSTVDACAYALKELFLATGVEIETYSLTWARS